MAMPAVIDPPGELMYSCTSFSGSSCARNNICAMDRLATISSMGVPIKMMLSRSRREEMSYARSPRLGCSITIGTSAMIAPSLCCYRYKPSWFCVPTGGGNLGRFAAKEELQSLLVPHPVFDALQGAVAGQPGADRFRSLLGLLGQGVDLVL